MPLQENAAEASYDDVAPHHKQSPWKHFTGCKYTYILHRLYFTRKARASEQQHFADVGFHHVRTLQAYYY